MTTHETDMTLQEPQKFLFVGFKQKEKEPYEREPSEMRTNNTT